MSNISLRWFIHCKSDEEKKSFENKLLRNKSITNALKAILESELKASLVKQRDPKNYALGSWSEFQADKIGEQRTLQKILDLLP